MSANDTIDAIIVANKSGLVAFKAKVFIDATGDGDVAAWAGASFKKGGEDGVDVYKRQRLWWPNGYGEQYLYDASLSLISSGKDTLDVKKMRIGIRELEYELSAYEDNSPIVRLNYNPTAALQDGKPAFDTVKRKKTDNKVRYTNYDGEFVPYLLKPVSSQGIELINDSLMKEYMVIKVNGQRIYCKGRCV